MSHIAFFPENKEELCIVFNILECSEQLMTINQFEEKFHPSNKQSNNISLNICSIKKHSKNIILKKIMLYLIKNIMNLLKKKRN